MTPSERSLIIAGSALTATAISLVWIHRFLPLYDLPIWMYETHLLHEAANGNPFFGEHFVFHAIPVPNLGLVGPLFLGSFFLSLETVTKLYLSLLVGLFPWAWRFVVKRLHPAATSLSFLGFAYPFNLFVFEGQSYLLGIIAALVALGLLVPRLRSMSTPDWLLLGFSCTILFLLHAIAWLVFLAIVGSLIARKWGRGSSSLFLFFASAVPSFGLALWYLLSKPWSSDAAGLWGFRSIAQNFFKPLGLLVKTYGIGVPIPITLINTGWIFGIAVAIVIGARRSLASNSPSPYLPAMLGMLALGIALPDRAAGLFQPGTRFILPALLCATLLVGSSIRSRWLPRVCMLLGLTSVAYNSYLFAMVDRQMTAFSNDIEATVDTAMPAYSIGLDWPAGSGWMDVGSASINPLTLTPYYSYLGNPAIAWIHGTALVRLKEDSRWCQPAIVGNTRAEMVQSVLAHVDDLKRFSTLYIIGDGPETDFVADVLRQNGYISLRSRELWKILSRRASSSSSEGESRPIGVQP